MGNNFTYYKAAIAAITSETEACQHSAIYLYDILSSSFTERGEIVACFVPYCNSYEGLSSKRNINAIMKGWLQALIKSYGETMTKETHVILARYAKSFEEGKDARESLYIIQEVTPYIAQMLYVLEQSDMLDFSIRHDVKQTLSASFFQALGLCSAFSSYQKKEQHPSYIPSLIDVEKDRAVFMMPALQHYVLLLTEEVVSLRQEVNALRLQQSQHYIPQTETWHDAGSATL